MKWKKIGQIFNPFEHVLLDDCFGFAQSPQAIAFLDYIRIYFSTRKKDLNGKFRSHISYVDMSKDFTKIIKVSTHPVIQLGSLGTFDEHGIFPISPVRVEDKIYAYTTGWNRRVSVSVDTSIGLAISQDEGQTFHKIGNGPILSSSLHEPFLVGDGFVKIYEGLFHMWYIYGTKWECVNENEAPDRVYKIGHATSVDGISWQKDNKQIISDYIDSNECQALPTVFRYKNRYHMYFCFRHMHGFRTDHQKGYRLGYAYSEDLTTWTRDDSHAGITISEAGWDSQMMCYPNVFECDGKFYLLYNGNEFGKYGFGVAVLEE